MKRFLTTLPSVSTAPVAVSADHFSVNGSTGGVQFYRYAATGTKDELIAVTPKDSLVVIDEKVTVLSAVLGDLSDAVLDKLAESLGVEELDDEQKILVTVTFTE